MVRARLPANPLFSVSGREPRPGVSRLEVRWPAWFALDSPQALCFRFPGANLGPGFSRLAARRSAWFALDSPQALYFRFPGANLGPGFSRLAARRPAWFALTSPQALCFRFPSANLGPGFSGLEARRSAWFALDSPQALYFRFPGANLGPGISGLEARRPAWFALTFPQALCFRFPGANLGPGISGFEARRPGVSRRGLLPPPRKPLRLRPGEQILHINSAPTPASGRLFRGAVCSPPPANPCSSVPGSKFFTQIPRRHPGPAGFSKARFAPRSPLTLAAPFRGANSSHKFRATVQKAPCRFIGKVLPPLQQFPRGPAQSPADPLRGSIAPAGPSPAGHF